MIPAHALKNHFKSLCRIQFGRIMLLLVLCHHAAVAGPSQGLAAARAGQVAQPLPSRGALHVLVMFGTFADDTVNSTQVPAWADSLFLPELPGSLTHYFSEMSHGQYRFTGSVARQIYRSRDAASAYTTTANGLRGGFGRFVQEIIDTADRDIDFGRFDNDGPDGQPNSGDDDGFVDALFVVLPDTPTGFLVSDANGLAALGLTSALFTDDIRAGGGRIRIRSDVGSGGPPGGAIQEGRTFASTVGIIAHEHGHLLGLPDLFDTGFTQGVEPSPAEDSGGIGYWGLMGHGARGWDDLGGPTPLSAWSLMQLGWLGIDNGLLRSIDTTQRDTRLEDSNRDGFVYLMPIQERQYLLVEHRRADGSYYDRRIPQDGVLIWHVNENVGANTNERAKLVDLVCADGLFADAGYPLGAQVAPVSGGDNLDYWAHDETYRTAYGGNLGDATDVFDGQRFTAFTPVTNPASRNVAVEGIRPEGTAMLADLIVGDRRKAGVLVENETWSGTIDVVADVTVPVGVALRIAAGATVRFFPDDRRGGQDVQRSELLVEGILTAGGGTLTTFTSGSAIPAAGDWSGIHVLRSGEIRLLDVVVEYAEDALRVDDASRGVLLEDVEIRRASGHGIQSSADDASRILTRVTVQEVAGKGLLLTGAGPVVIDQLVVRECGDVGLHRAGGVIQCSNSEFTDNGRQMPGAINMLLGEAVFGQVTDNRFRGGTGLMADGTVQVQITDNLFTATRVAVSHRNSRAWIVGNTIAGSDTAFQISGATQPDRFELNRVGDAQVLVDNRTSGAVLAIRNWWGTVQGASIEARMRGDVVFEPFLNFDPRSPVTFDIGPVFPNPSTSTVNIPYTVGIGDVSVGDQSNLTRVVIRNVLGGLVRQLVADAAAPGIYSVQWDGLNQQGAPAAAGLYYAELDVGGIRLYTAMLRLR